MKRTALKPYILQATLSVTLVLAIVGLGAAAHGQITTTANAPGTASGTVKESEPKRPKAQDEVQYMVPARPVGPPQKFNARISPLGLLIGYFNLDFDFKVSDQWTFGPTFSYWSFNFDSSGFQNGKIKTTSTSIGVRGTWAQNGAFKNGLYFSPMIQYRSAKAEGVSSTSGATITASGGLPVLTGLVGYQHWLNENLNFNVGAGLSVGTQSTKIEVRDGSSVTNVETSQTGGLALDLMLGYSF